MTDKRYKKLIRIYSIFAGVGVLTSVFTGSLRDVLFPGISDTGWVIAISTGLNVLAFTLLFSLMLTRIELTPKLEKRILLFLVILLVLIIPGVVFEIFPLVIVPSVMILLFLGILVFFSPKRSMRRILILLFFAVVGFAMKRQHWPGTGPIITLTLSILTAGSFLHGIYILKKHKENLYFRIIGSFCSLLIALQSLATLFKFQHWPGAGLFAYSAGIPTLITTLLVLITLPGSGFINWKKEQQHILTRKILIPWVFFLLFMALKTLLPVPVQQRIFESDVTIKVPFNMTPYDIEMKDGMEERE